MNERHERIERLAERWLEARATDAEERELRELLRTTEGLPESLRELSLLFDGFGALAEERMPRSEAPDGEWALRSDEKPLRPFADRPGLPPESDSAAQLDLAVQLDLAAQPDDRTLSSGRLSGPSSVRNRHGRRRRLFWSVAAAAVVALGLFLGAELLRKPYCYIDGKPVYDREIALQTTVYFDSFAILEAPDRLVDELIENN